MLCQFAPAPARAAPERSLLLLGPEAADSERLITQVEWAASLVQALELESALPEPYEDLDLFSLLCAEDAELSLGSGGRRTPARAAFRASERPQPVRERGEPLRLVVAAPATALYRLSVEGVGPQRWSVDRRPVGHVDPTILGVAEARTVVPLPRGPHELAAVLTHGARVDAVELVAHRALCIAPAGGWRAAHPLSFGGKARTMVRAFGLERRLPPDGEALLVEGERFADVSPWGQPTQRRMAEPASGEAWAVAVGSPAQFSYRVHLSEPGVHTLLARVHGGAQIWSIDGRYRVTTRPEPSSDGFAWSHVVTLPLDAGEHAFRALVPPSGGIDLLRLVRRRSGDADYVAVLEDAGFEEGAPERPVTQAAAIANLRNPNFAPLARGFLSRLAGAAPDHALALVERELETLYSRPLSPTLAPEL